MRFVANGPDIPLEVLQAAEDGTLVLFCGAGISAGAGLPLFGGLVERIRHTLNVPEETHVLNTEVCRARFDCALGWLEKNYGREQVREAIIQALSLEDGADLSMHRDLLTLARSRKTGKSRLVTTNVDRAFPKICREFAATIDTAPKLPVPKESKWHSIVHIHGLIDHEVDPQGHSMVMTSADFGAAYLTEGWASRFITELFRHYTVLFVGYSVDDPVMRYAVDAMAADRTEGIQVGNTYALAGFSPSKGRPKDKAEQQWIAKNVQPILFNERHHFILLRKTLAGWASNHRMGLQGRIGLIREKGRLVPQRPFSSDEAVQQVLWALGQGTTPEDAGRLAREFAELDPPAPLEWLDVFEKEKLLTLPSADPDSDAPIPIASAGYAESRTAKLNPVTEQLCRWLAHYRDEPKLIDWVIESGCSLHPQARWVFGQEPPGPEWGDALRDFWWVLTGDLPIGTGDDSRGWGARGRWAKEGYPLALVKAELPGLIAPCLSFKVAIRFGEAGRVEKDREYVRKATSLSQIADPVISSGWGQHPHSLLDDALAVPAVRACLPDISFALTARLRQTMDLFAVCGQASAKEDDSHFRRPSLSPHEQNRRFEGWTVLISCLHESFKALAKKSEREAKALVALWRTIDYPVFKRFTMEALGDANLYAPEEALEFLLHEDDGWWLWSHCTSHEAALLQDHIWSKGDAPVREGLIQALVAGPPQEMCRGDVPGDEWQEVCDRLIWAALTRIRASQGNTVDDGEAALASLADKYPRWELSEGEKQGFQVYFGEGHFEEETKYTVARLCNFSDAKLLDVLKGQSGYQDHAVSRVWATAVGEEPERAIRFMSYLSQSEITDSACWSGTVSRLEPNEKTLPLWPDLVPLLGGIPNQLSVELCRDLSQFLERFSKHLDQSQDADFLELWDPLLGTTVKAEVHAMKNPVSTAINSPMGALATALLERFWRREPKSGQGLGTISKELESRLTTLATGTSRNHCHARTVLCSQLQPLFATDARWAEMCLLPYFRWQSGEAPSAWQGYLWNPRISVDLSAALKPSLLEALVHIGDLGEARGNLHQIVAVICFYDDDSYTRGDQARMLGELDHDGLVDVAETLRRLTEEAEDPETAWRERVEPLLPAWPKATEKRSSAVSAALIKLLLVAGQGFPSGLARLKHAFVPLDCNNAGFLSPPLEESSLPEDFPEQFLELLSKVTVHESLAWRAEDWRGLLNRISQAKPASVRARPYQQLDELLIRRGA
jgi:hypothetical protein